MRTVARYNDEQIAMICHATNSGLQEVHGHPSPSAAWVNEDAEKKASILHGVKLARQGHTPRELHGAWVEFKAAQGWKYGPVHDWADKTHPNMVAYEDLPPGERDKDEVFLLLVSWAAGKMGSFN